MKAALCSFSSWLFLCGWKRVCDTARFLFFSRGMEDVVKHVLILKIVTIVKECLSTNAFI